MARKKATNKQKAYIVEYMKNNCKRISLQLNIENDKDIIEWMNHQENKNAYLKQLIRDDMKTHL